MKKLEHSLYGAETWALRKVYQLDLLRETRCFTKSRGGKEYST